MPLFFSALTEATGTGVYGPLQEKWSSFLLFCDFLEQLAGFCYDVRELQMVLKAGGDWIAATYLSGGIQWLLNMVTQCVDKMQAYQEEIKALAESAYDSILVKKSPSAEEKIWENNYLSLIAAINSTTHRQTLDALKGAVSGIEKILADWKTNIEEKLDEFFTHWQRFDTRLLRAGTRMGLAAPLHYKPMPFRAVSMLGTQHKMLINAPAAPLVLRDAEIKGREGAFHKEELLRAIDAIKIQLTLYAVNPSHGYRFNLASLDVSIQMRSMSDALQRQHGGKLFCIIREDLQNPTHQARIEWMYQSFKLLVSPDSPDLLLKTFQTQLNKAKATAPFKETPLRRPKILNTIDNLDNILKSVDHLLRSSSTDIAAASGAGGEQEDATAAASHKAASGGARIIELTNLTEVVMDVEEEKEDAAASSTTDAAASPGKATGIASTLRALIEDCNGVECAAKRMDFLEGFWKDLCLLRDPIHVQKYRERYTQPVLILSQELDFLETIMNGIQADTPSEWAMHTAKQLLDKPMKDAIEKEVLQGELTLRKTDLQEKFEEARKDVVMGGDGAILAWTSPTYQKLTRVYQDKKTDPKLSKLLSADVFFAIVSHRLLQQQDISTVDNEQTIANGTELDLLLTEIFQRHLSASTKEHQSFYLSIAQGLMALGANPLQWMDQQITLSEEGIPDAIFAAGISKITMPVYFLAAKQVDAILSNLQFRAKYLGECMLFLEAPLAQLLNAFNQFVKKLTACVESDNDFWWELFVKITLQKTPKDGARYQRAAVLWAGLRYIYVLLNDVLFLKTDEVRKTGVFNSSTQLMRKTLEWHEQESKKYWVWYNTGSNAAKKLKKSFEAVVEAAASILAVQRSLFESDMRIKAFEGTTRVLLQEKNQNQKKAAEAEQKATEAGQKAAEAEQKAAEAGQKAAEAGQKAASAERREDTLLHNYLIHKMTKKMRSGMSGEVLQNRLNEVIESGCRTFSTEPATIRTRILEIVRTTEGFAELRPEVNRLFSEPSAAAALAAHGHFSAAPPLASIQGEEGSFAASLQGK